MDQSIENVHSAITWEAHEYEHWEHGADWYWAFGIIAIALFVAALLFKNILLALIILIGSFGIILHTYRKPPLVSFQINETGVMINKRLYPFASLKSFALVLHPSTKIYLQSKKKILPFIVIPFEKEDYVYIRDFLKDFLEEVDHDESLMEKIFDVLGF